MRSGAGKVGRRVLVPLDGSSLAESILPDARRLAGPHGELLLIRDVTSSEQPRAVEAARDYLETVAQALRSEGVQVRTQPLVMVDAAMAIDEEAEILQADLIAIATHGRSPAERLWLGSVAWRALLRSTVPVLLRHVELSEGAGYRDEPEQRRIMVPLDGSALAEKALPLATQLAQEWQAPLYVVQVIPEPLLEGTTEEAWPNDPEAAEQYLRGVAGRLPEPAEARVLTGSVVGTLVDTVDQASISDIVMTTHGRTGLTRVIVGSIADALIQQLHCPIIVIPALAALAEER